MPSHPAMTWIIANNPHDQRDIQRKDPVQVTKDIGGNGHISKSAQKRTEN